MTANTREVLLQVGVKAVRLSGFAGVSINDIVSASGVPKGSFHYYFENKEAYGLALLDYFFSLMHEMLEPLLNDPTVPAIERLQNFFRCYAERMGEESCKTGCLVGMMAMEMSDGCEEVRRKSRTCLAEMQSLLKPVVQLGQKEGDIKSELNAGTVSAFLVNSWQGALLRMKTQQTDRALRDFEEIVFGYLLRSKDSAEFTS